MSEGSAQVDVETLKHFRRGLQQFCEHVAVALGDGESDVRRTQLWLELEASLYWSNEIKKREKVVERCKEAVRMKTIFRDASGGRQSAVDEEKALKRAQQHLAMALEKAANVKKYLMRLQKEALLYKGHVQRLSTSVSNELPTAGHKLAAMIATIEQYAAVAPAEATSTASSGSSEPSMARPEQSEVSTSSDESSSDVADAPAEQEIPNPSKETTDGHD